MKKPGVCTLAQMLEVLVGVRKASHPDQLPHNGLKSVASLTNDPVGAVYSWPEMSRTKETDR